MKDMSNRQLFDYQQRKIKSQDQDIDEIIGYAKEGREINKELKTELLKQGRQLDDIEMDVIINLEIFNLTLNLIVDIKFCLFNNF